MEPSEYGSSIKISELGAEIFKILPSEQRFALDIGGSLSKLAYQSKRKWKENLVTESNASAPYFTREQEKEQDSLHFIKFQTTMLADCLEFIRQNFENNGIESVTVRVTGGGAYKYKSLIEEKLNCKVEKEDEMACLVRGCAFVLKNIQAQLFSYDDNSTPPYAFADEMPANPYPFLLVNIGSGISVLKVNSATEFSRVGGSSIGGGTFWGLGSLLAGNADFDSLIDMAANGNHRNVDMLVGDIYGDNQCVIYGLPPDIIASSFGKASRAEKGSMSVEDKLRSLLITISYNISQLAYLYAKQHGLERVLFAGFYIRGHALTMRTLANAINFWSKGEISAHFLRHEGYLGAIGAFMQCLLADCQTAQLSASWAENLCNSTTFATDCINSYEGALAKLELVKSSDYVPFPLLASYAQYTPDTWDLGQDLAARDYWLQCFEQAIDRHRIRAANSQPDVPSAQDRATVFSQLYARFFREAAANPCAFGQLSVRRILDVQEHCLRECGFPDPYCEQKKSENEAALSGLSHRLQQLEQLPDGERLMALLTGLLAGNVFDWGAGRVAELLAKGSFRMQEAEACLESRPWLVDNADAWVTRLLAGSYSCCMIFIDNSGFDLLQGVLPLAIELLQRNIKVILVANQRPALNDVTIFELRPLMCRVAEFVPTVADALANSRLILLSSGSSSPCLDLRRVSHELADACSKHSVDLIVIEGMGRAVHTNLYARFQCDCLKLAVVKNAWLADRLGGQLFSVICSFQHAVTAASDDQ